jgi:competence transcription factor ComK
MQNFPEINVRHQSDMVASHLRNVIVQKLKYKTYNIRCSNLNTLGLRLSYFHKLESSICNTSMQSANLATPYISATVVGIVRQ